MFVLPGGMAEPDPPVLTAATGVAVTATTTHTFTGISIGPAYATRRIYIYSGGRATSSGLTGITSITVNGNAATLVISGTGSGSFNGGYAYYDLASGTTATIVVTWNMAIPTCVIAIHASHNTYSVLDSETTSTSLDGLTSSITLPSAQPAAVILMAIGTANTTGSIHSGGTEDAEYRAGGLTPVTLLVGSRMSYGSATTSIGYTFDTDVGTNYVALALGEAF